MANPFLKSTATTKPDKNPATNVTKDPWPRSATGNANAGSENENAFCFVSVVVVVVDELEVAGGAVVCTASQL